MAEAITLQALLGDYPHTSALRKGQLTSPLVKFDFAEVKSLPDAFKPLVRESKFDLGELAIGTFLQAKSFGKPYALLPFTVAGRFQHGALAYYAGKGEVMP